MKRFILVFLLLAHPAWADAPLRSISVTGVATKMAEPDEAIVRFTIESRDHELERAKQLQDEKLAKLYALAGDWQIAKKHLKTQHARLQPEYRHKDGKRHFKGYVSRVSIMMTLEKIDQVAMVMQGLVKAGFDRLDGVQYLVKQREAIAENLSIEALKHARTKARGMAEALEMKLGKPLQIRESGAAAPPPIAMRAMAMESIDSYAAPQAPPAGEHEIRQTVSVVFELKE